jgi:hypothetical protein
VLVVHLGGTLEKTGMEVEDAGEYQLSARGSSSEKTYSPG